MKCEFCRSLSVREIRGISLCLEHFLEALEHCADFTNDFTDVRFTSRELKHPLLAEAAHSHRQFRLIRERQRKSQDDLSLEQLEFLKGAA